MEETGGFLENQCLTTLDMSTHRITVDALCFGPETQLECVVMTDDFSVGVSGLQRVWAQFQNSPVKLTRTVFQ